MKKRRLLAIDDEPAMNEIIRSVGEGLGFEVRVTDSADAFADHHESFAPDVVVLDLVMPEVDGLELAYWLSHVGSTARVIILTGHNPHYAESARMMGERGELGEVMVLTKPVSITALREALTAA